MKILEYMIDGRAGRAYLADDGVVTTAQLMEGLQPVPEEYDNPSDEQTRLNRSNTFASYGASQYFLPDGAASTSKSRLSRWRKAAAMLTKLEELFDGEQCALNSEAMTILTAFGLHNYGGSDEALEMAIAGSWAALFHHIGYPIEPAQLGKGTPSRRSIARWECPSQAGQRL